MRPKLIILSALITAFAFAALWFCLARFVLNAPLILRDNWFYIEAFALVVIINAVGITVYRRTSKRRKIQALLASMITLLLFFVFLLVLDFIANLIAQNAA